MRILNIHFKNINSLDGENRIDFEQTPFSDTGVFAITGPNGSGKSSILDAITLGLYGETFRFHKPSEFVMTKNTAECFSVVEFSLDANKYQAGWAVQRKDLLPEGEFLPATMHLKCLNNGELLATTAGQVSLRIAELTGMNFRNFTRSILLAQGDFAAFLNALDAERLDILEKIISVDIYAEYKKEIGERAEHAQNTLDAIDKDLAAISLIPEIQEQAYLDDLEDFKAQYQELASEQAVFKKQQEVLKNISLNERLTQARKNEIAAVEEKATQIALSLQQILENQDALDFKADADEINENQQAIAAVKQNLAAFYTELKSLQAKFGTEVIPDDLGDKSLGHQQQAIASLSSQLNVLATNKQSEMMLLQSLGVQLTDKTSTLSSVTAWLEAHSSDEVLLTRFPEIGKLRTLKTDLVELTRQQISFDKWEKKTTAGIKITDEALKAATSKLAQLTGELEVEEKALELLADGRSPEVIKSLWEDQQQRVQSFTELRNCAVSHQQLDPKVRGFMAFFVKEDTSEQDITDLTQELLKLESEQKREENIRLVLEENAFRANLLKKLTADREHLVDGKPCPLCGGLEHPYSKNPPVIADSKQALADQKTKLKTLVNASNALSRKLQEAKKLNEKDRAKKDRRQQFFNQWLSLCNRLNVAGGKMSIDNLRLMKQLLKDETTELSLITAFATKYRNKLTQIEKLTQAITDSTAKMEQLAIRLEELKAKLHERGIEKTELENALAARVKDEQQLATVTYELLTLLGENMPTKAKEAALLESLTNRKLEYHSYAVRCKNLTEELALLTVKQTACLAEIDRCNRELEQLQAVLHSEEGIALHLAVLEKQQLIAGKEQSLSLLETKAMSLQQALQEKLQETRFTRVEKLNETLAFIAGQKGLEQQLTALTLQKETKEQELEKYATALQADIEFIGEDFNEEHLRLELKRNKEQLDIAQLEITRIERLLKHNAQQQQTCEALLKQLQLQQQKAQPYFEEARLLLPENGMALRRKVQNQLSEKLLLQTNTLLEKISGRYYLRQIPCDLGLALEVEDTYQGNARRQVKSLSGGESFVLSLALALGLSELANNGRSVDSLFLDEGFGNLDAETLYTVISTLEGLNTYGKTVGVISHVEAVQKRFKAQLQIVKKTNGLGELRQA